MSIKKIAEITGVSVATVSRVLNNPDYRTAKKEVRDKILRAAMDINYVPNDSARNLKMNKNNKYIYYVDIVVTRMDAGGTDPFFSELTRYVESEIHQNNCILSNIWYHSVFSDEARCEKENVQALIDEMFCGDKKPDGFIIIGKCSEKVLKLLKNQKVEIVSINRNSTNYEVDEVICDGEKIASMAVEYLISLGHRQIAYVGECGNEARYKGYRNTLEKHNIRLDNNFVIETMQSVDKGFEVIEDILKKKVIPTAIYCANDIIAVGMLKYLQIGSYYGSRPSIISSDDIEIAQFTTPMLTTVHLPKRDMAKCAIWMLLDRLNRGHEAVIHMEMCCKLMVRSSCYAIDFPYN